MNTDPNNSFLSFTNYFIHSAVMMGIYFGAHHVGKVSSQAPGSRRYVD